MTHHNWFLLAKNWSEVSHFLTERTICESSERDQIANYWSEVIICIDNNVFCRVLMSFKALCKYWQNACWNVISNLNLQQEREYLKQCGHLLAPTKNMVIKHFIATGKFGWKISTNHYEMLCLIRTTTQGKKLDKHLKKHIDNFISTSYGPEFCVTHKCISENDQEISKTDIPENIFKEKDSSFILKS